MNQRSALENAYFDKLEKDCVDFINRDDAGNSFVKDEFVVSVGEMCDYLGMKSWVKDWTVQMLGE